MNRRFVLVAALPLMLALTAAAPRKPRRPVPPPPPPPPAAPLGDVVRIAMVTEQGTIELELDHRRAPLTVENFVRYVDGKRLDGTSFYRAMHLSWGEQPNGLLQGGLQGIPAKLLPPVAHEPTSLTGLSHKAGTISMARYAPGTATADFSILLSDLTGLDADPKSANPDVQAGFAAFGHVVSGMDVVRRLWDMPRSPTKGEGVMKGEMFELPPKILTVRRVPVPMSPPPPPAP